jgi:hypothetical protein
MLDDAEPIRGLSRFCHNFEVGYVLPERSPVLVTKQKPCERAPLPLPVMRQGFESYVLREQNTPQCSRSFQ